MLSKHLGHAPPCVPSGNAAQGLHLRPQTFACCVCRASSKGFRLPPIPKILGGRQALTRISYNTQMPRHESEEYLESKAAIGEVTSAIVYQLVVAWLCAASQRLQALWRLGICRTDMGALSLNG